MQHIIFLIFLIFLDSISNSAIAQTSQLDPVYLSHKDIVYKTTPSGDSLSLDVFLPAEHNNTAIPFVFFIHGGAWVKGDKSFEKQYYTRSLRDSLQKNGYGFVSINYRLLNKDIDFEKQVSDVYDALNWVKKNSTKYNLDLKNVGVMGESAGAHLALLLAYSDVEKKDINFKYVLDVFGPTDLNKIFKTRASWFVTTLFKMFKPKIFKLRNDILSYMTLQDITKNKSKVIEKASYYSPINYIDATDTTPVLILHGNKDKIVAYNQSVSLDAKLNKIGTKTELVKVLNGNHGFTTTEKSRLDELVLISSQFIKENTSR